MTIFDNEGLFAYKSILSISSLNYNFKSSTKYYSDHEDQAESKENSYC